MLSCHHDVLSVMWSIMIQPLLIFYPEVCLLFQIPLFYITHDLIFTLSTHMQPLRSLSHLRRWWYYVTRQRHDPGHIREANIQLTLARRQCTNNTPYQGQSVIHRAIVPYLLSTWKRLWSNLSLSISVWCAVLIFQSSHNQGTCSLCNLSWQFLAITSVCDLYHSNERPVLWPRLVSFLAE